MTGVAPADPAHAQQMPTPKKARRKTRLAEVPRRKNPLSILLLSIIHPIIHPIIYRSPLPTSPNDSTINLSTRKDYTPCAVSVPHQNQMQIQMKEADEEEGELREMDYKMTRDLL
jgi:hypothetical protein